jgi:hypothetical protein
MNARDLEAEHDYIQTLFPIPETSMIVGRSAPIIDGEVFNAFRSRPELQARLKDAFNRILWFYGLVLEKDFKENHVVS